MLRSAATRRDGRGHGRRHAVAGRLLDVAPQVGLDVDDDEPVPVRTGALHEQREVGVVRLHGRRVVEVREVLVEFVTAGRGARLK
jgi:hypothetical protein